MPILGAADLLRLRPSNSGAFFLTPTSNTKGRCFRIVEPSDAFYPVLLVIAAIFLCRRSDSDLKILTRHALSASQRSCGSTQHDKTAAPQDL